MTIEPTDAAADDVRVTRRPAPGSARATPAAGTGGGCPRGRCGMLFGVRVRRATVQDAEAIAQILAEVAEEGLIATEPPVDVPGRGGAPAHDACERRTVGVLDLGGWATDRRQRERSRDLAGRSLAGMAILPKARGRGGGRMLLDAVLAHAAEWRAHKVDVEVWPDNGRAIALYVAAGFSVEGLRRDHYLRRDGSLRSALLMARHVDRLP